MLDIGQKGSNKVRLVIICGPTASGKTRMGIELAQQVNAEILCADSRQVYLGMDIGTAKPSREEQKLVKHHCIDLVYPDEDFSAAEFKIRAEQVIEGLTKEGKNAIIVGGTGLYIKALTKGLFDGAGKAPKLRDSLKKELEDYGEQDMYRKLADIDPVTASRLHPHDSFRVRRALEVYSLTGRRISALQREHGFSGNSYEVLKIGLTVEREELYRRIEQRVEEMLRKGLVEEVQSLLNRGYNETLPSMKGLGYKEILGYLRKKYDLKEAVSLIKRNTKRYAKRQLTWFKGDGEVLWLEPDRKREKIFEKVKDFSPSTGSGQVIK
jgi:tRNA dimethylallyltransferase